MRSHVATAILTAIPVGVIAYVIGSWHPFTADGDPVHHRTYSNIENPNPVSLPDNKIDGIPSVCVHGSDECHWYVDFQTDYNALSNQYPCATQHCMHINAQMTRTEINDDGTTGGTASLYLRMTISASPPPPTKEGNASPPSRPH